MSIKLMDKVWRSHISDARLKLLVLAIADAANDDGECWPKIDTLAEKIDRKTRQTQRLMRQLETNGWLSREVRSRKDGLQTSNMYVLHANKLPSAALSHVDTPTLSHVDTPTLSHVDTPSMNLHIEPSCEPSDRNSVSIGAAPSAGAPAPVSAPSKQSKAKRPKPEPDSRKDHWAIKTIRECTQRYPEKILWDDIIKATGEKDETKKLTACIKVWLARGFNKNNSAGYINWFKNGIPENRSKAQQVAEMNSGTARRFVQ
jgi:hypothetical protein